MKHVPTVYSTLALATLLAGCAHQSRPEAARAPAPVAAAEPLPPNGAARGLASPSPDAGGHYATINSGVGDKEAIWHFRAALNVAALSCRNQSIVSNYNQLLRSRKAVFAAAYASETARLRSTALDQHQTRLYNFFAQPPAKIAFCRAADTEASQAVSVSSAEFPAFAVKALDRLEAPVIAFYAAYDRYRRELASWKANPHKNAGIMTAAASPKPAAIRKKERAAVVTASVASAPAPARKKDSAGSNSWRVQIGAFSGQSAAEAAWKRARERVPGMASYKPSFAPVPGKPSLVRLQLAIADRDGAQKFCATATASGINCLPVAG